MRTPCRAALLAAVFLAAASPALAQGSVTLSVTVSPSSLTVQAGNGASASVEMRNDGVTGMDVDLVVSPGGLSISINQTRFFLPPRTSVTVNAGIGTGGLPPGDHFANFTVRSVNATVLGEREQDSAMLRVTIVPRNASGNATNATPPSSPAPQGNASSPSNGTSPGGGAGNATGGSGDASEDGPDEGATGSGDSGTDVGDGTSGTGTGDEAGGSPSNATPSSGSSEGPSGSASTQPSSTSEPATSSPTSGGGGGGPSSTVDGASTAAPASPPASSASTPAAPTPSEPTPKPPPPQVAPERMDLSAASREPASFQVQVTNPHSAPQSFDASLSLPSRWVGGLERSRLDLGPHASATLNGTLQPLSGARDGDALLTLAGPGGSVTVTLRLRAPPPSQPAAPSSEGSTPAPAGTLAAPPGANEAATRRPLLRVEPAEANLVPGGRAVLRLVVTNDGAEPLDASPRIVPPRGFLLESPLLPTSVAPGETVGIPFVVRAAADGEPGTSGTGAAALEGPPMLVAEFRLVVVAPVATDLASAVVGHARPESDPWLGALVVTATGALALAGAWAWRRWHWAFVGLYARLKPHKILEHPTRAALRDLVAAEPGILLSEAQRRLGLANGALRHHVDRLETTGILRSVADGSHRRLYPAEAGRVEGAPALADRVLRAVEERGSVAVPALAAELGVSRQALHYHVKRLAKQGRLRPVRVGNELVLTPPAAEAAPRGGPARAAP